MSDTPAPERDERTDQDEDGGTAERSADLPTAKPGDETATETEQEPFPPHPPAEPG